MALCASGLGAQEEFTPPQAYPVERYEAVWSKNPFTLKTAPVALDRVSFAKDLAIGGHYGESTNPTIVVVNTKTNERTSLKPGVAASNGMTLTSFSIQPSRRDTSAVVTLGGESATLHYDDSFIKQASAPRAGSDPSQRGPAGADPGRPGQMPPNDIQYPNSRGSPSLPAPPTSAGPGGNMPGSPTNRYIPTPVGRRKLLIPTAPPKDNSNPNP